MSIVLTEFARARLFRANRRNTIQDVAPDAFERHLNDVPPIAVLDGYAPFCKLHVHRNWTSTRCLAVPITDDNRHLLRTDYEARTPDPTAARINSLLNHAVFGFGLYLAALAAHTCQGVL